MSIEVTFKCDFCGKKVNVVNYASLHRQVISTNEQKFRFVACRDCAEHLFDVVIDFRDRTQGWKK